MTGSAVDIDPKISFKFFTTSIKNFIFVIVSPNLHASISLTKCQIFSSMKIQFVNAARLLWVNHDGRSQNIGRILKPIQTSISCAWKDPLVPKTIFTTTNNKEPVIKGVGDLLWRSQPDQVQIKDAVKSNETIFFNTVKNFWPFKSRCIFHHRSPVNTFKTIVLEFEEKSNDDDTTNARWF